jgi:hypothetical protein
VQVDYPEPKAAIWATHGARWTTELATIAQQHQTFELRYRKFAVTDSAVIALAAPIEPVRHLRAAIGRGLTLPPLVTRACRLPADRL